MEFIFGVLFVVLVLVCLAFAEIFRLRKLVTRIRKQRAMYERLAIHYKQRLGAA